MTYTIPLFDLNYDESEERAVLEVLKSRWISMGERTVTLEQRFADHLNTKHAVAVSSCTAALHLAMRLLDIGPGDEVIVPSLTFVATVNAVRYVGATPVFADITGLDNLSIDPVAVEQAITPRTRGIVAVHYGGFPCNMEALRRIAVTHGIHLVEDAAHAPSATFQGHPLGTFGEIGCFSFFSNKNISCAEGGMLVTASDEYARRARQLRSHGMTTLSFDRAKGHATTYDVNDIGYNYRLDDIRASLALAQMDKLERDIKQRERVRNFYLERLGDIGDVVIPYTQCEDKTSNYIFPIVLKSGGIQKRDYIREYLRNKSIETSVHYPAVHRFHIYRSASTKLPKTEHVSDHEITLPMYAALDEKKVDRICDCLIEALEQVTYRFRS